MSTVRIITASCGERANQLLTRLSSHREFKIIAHVESEPDLLIALRRTLSSEGQLPDEPIVVITSHDADQIASEGYSRLLAEFTELIVYYIGIDESVRCRNVAELIHLPTDRLFEDLQRVSLGLNLDVSLVRDSPRELDR